MPILYTGTNPQKYQYLGDIIHFPMINISKVNLSFEEIKRYIYIISQADIILLTSRFGVEYFFQFVQEQNYPLEDLQKKDFIVIGEITAKALKKMNIQPVLQATVETSQGLFAEIQETLDLKGKHILFPRSALSNPYLKEHLRDAGAYVEECVIYQNTKPEKKVLPTKEIKTIIFTSPSTVKNFLDDYNVIPAQWTILSKGPVTQRALTEAGYISEVL